MVCCTAASAAVEATAGARCLSFCEPDAAAKLALSDLSRHLRRYWAGAGVGEHGYGADYTGTHTRSRALKSGPACGIATAALLARRWIASRVRLSGGYAGAMDLSHEPAARRRTYTRNRGVGVAVLRSVDLRRCGGAGDDGLARFGSAGAIDLGCSALAATGGCLLLSHGAHSVYVSATAGPRQSADDSGAVCGCLSGLRIAHRLS